MSIAGDRLEHTASRRALPRRVALCIEQSTAFGRQAVRGVAQWLRSHDAWVAVASGPDGGDAASEWLSGHVVHGIIAGGVAVPPALARKRAPTVLLGHGSAAAACQGIHADDRAIGEAAADHLCDQGFRRLAYCSGVVRAIPQRREGFMARARQRGCAVESFGAASHESLAEWLTSLKTPVGVMGCDDRMALAVIDACREAGRRVPDDVAVVGVGNDDVLCELASPRLTSVMLDGVRMGFLAAETLAAALTGDRGALSRRKVVPPLGVEIRGSTDTLAVADPDLRTALRVIRERACAGVTIDDLADVTLLGRRTLERRFKVELGRSIHDEILRVRIAAARRTLAETDAKLATVAANTGFADVASLCHAFKRVTGQRPGDYRKLCRG